jgi:hypothetical protein
MNRKIFLPLVAGLFLGISVSVLAQSTTNQPGESDMMAAMMAMAQPGENHKQLESLAGKWSYSVKWWMNPQSPPSESSGTTVAKLAMGGRYLISNHTSKITMPGSDGKMTTMEFQGMSIDGYDNAKKKFVSSWIDNMGTGIMNSEGAYDDATKTLTYNGSYEPMPGMVTKVREVCKMTDADHHTMEMFEDRGGTLVKTMEISYTRKK